MLRHGLGDLVKVHSVLRGKIRRLRRQQPQQLARRRHEFEYAHRSLL
jgi:hypothetical protein